ncbi:MAG: hypothetical protein IJA30_04250 [Bacilli bacterium]|nr:hypothetical protein [Bacilli bacterium]
MKILNVENNKLYAYVQRKNLKSLIRFNNRLPKKFYKFAKEIGLNDSDETHDEEFIRTSDKKFIKLVMQADWIPDYRDLRDLSDEELQSAVDELTMKIQDLGSLYNTMPYQEQRISYIPEQYAKANQKLKDINAYLWTRQGKYDTPVEIPFAIDSRSTIISSNGILQFGRSLDHKKILVTKKDGTTFNEGYQINPIEINMGLMVFMSEENLTPNEPGQMDLTVRPEATHKFLVVDYNFQVDKDYVPPVKEEKETPTRLKQYKKTFINKPVQQIKKDEN